MWSGSRWALLAVIALTLLALIALVVAAAVMMGRARSAKKREIGPRGARGATGPTGASGQGGGGGDSTGTTGTSACMTTIGPYIVGPGCADFPTIQEALDVAATEGANSQNGGVTIYVKPGTYPETVTLFDGTHVVGLATAPSAGGGLETMYASNNGPVIVAGSIIVDLSVPATGPSGVARFASIGGVQLLPTGSAASAISVIGRSSLFGLDTCAIKDTTVGSANMPIGLLLQDATANVTNSNIQGLAALGSTGIGMRLNATDSSFVSASASSVLAGAEYFYLELANCYSIGQIDASAAGGGGFYNARASYLEGLHTSLFVAPPAPASTTVSWQGCELKPGVTNLPVIQAQDNSCVITINNCEASATQNLVLSEGIVTISDSGVDQDNTAGNGNPNFQSAGQIVALSTSTSNAAMPVLEITRQTSISLGQGDTGVFPIDQIQVASTTTMLVRARIVGAVSNNSDVTGAELTVTVNGTLGIVGSVNTLVQATSNGLVSATWSAGVLSINVIPPSPNSGFSTWTATTTRQVLSMS